MYPVVGNPVICESRAPIVFLHAKNMNVAEIQHELCVVYSKM
jgi:hypothetical protein